VTVSPARVLLTRPREQSEAFAAALEAALPGRYEPVIAPLLEIVPLPADIDLTGAQGLLFTSANGVAQFAARSPDRALPAYCVGDMTARAARAAGFDAHSADGDVEALARLAIAEARPGGGPYLHVRGRHAAGDLVGRLAASGVAACGLALYDQVPAAIGGPAATLLAAGGIPVLTAFSPRSAAGLAGQIRSAGWDIGASTLVSLSAAADAAFDAPEPGRRMIAPAPTRAGMIAALGAL
jgi:uroporphyrinogen-III synthase